VPFLFLFIPLGTNLFTFKKFNITHALKIRSILGCLSRLKPCNYGGSLQLFLSLNFGSAKP
ncbi:MAG: hypothetical protein WBC06_13255, partial [Chitinophagaceae bacterium]